VTAAVPAAPQPPDAEDLNAGRPAVWYAEDLNAGRPAVWSGAVAPGGMVCAVPDDLTADGICGNPVESEPCNRHDGEPAAPARSLTAPDVVAGLLADVAERDERLAEVTARLATTQAHRERLNRELATSAREQNSLTAQLDRYRNERDEARGTCDRLRQEALKRYGMVPSWVKRALEADGG